MDAAERRDLLERANRQSATIGQDLPETITVGDDDLPLEEFLIEARKVEGIPDVRKSDALAQPSRNLRFLRTM